MPAYNNAPTRGHKSSFILIESGGEKKTKRHAIRTLPCGILHRMQFCGVRIFIRGFFACRQQMYGDYST